MTLLASREGGSFPCSNSLVVAGSQATVLVDPSIEVTRRGRTVGSIDLIVVSHGHEDHVAGLHVFPEAPAYAHPADAAAVRDPEALVSRFCLDEPAAGRFRQDLQDVFSVAGHADVREITDGDVIDLGGRTLTVVHLPGHTAGHCGLLVEPDGFLFIGDIDLTGFGPYYGDESSDLDAFEASFDRLRGIEARWYGTAHQRGVLEGRDAFLSALDAFSDVLARRDETVLRLLQQPRTLAEIADHRLVYRPHVDSPYVATVERWSLT